MHVLYCMSPADFFYFFDELCWYSYPVDDNDERFWSLIKMMKKKMIDDKDDDKRDGNDVTEHRKRCKRRKTAMHGTAKWEGDVDREHVRAF
jgi:hypothetical protein